MPLGKNSPSSSISSSFGISEESKAEVGEGKGKRCGGGGAVTGGPLEIEGEFKCRDSANVCDGRNDQAGRKPAY